MFYLALVLFCSDDKFRLLDLRSESSDRLITAERQLIGKELNLIDGRRCVFLAANFRYANE